MGAVEIRHREHRRGCAEGRVALTRHAGVLDAIEIVTLVELGEDVTEVLADLLVGAQPDSLLAIDRPALGRW